MEFLNLTSLKKYLNQTELLGGAKKVWHYAESHLSIAIRIGLIVYGALVIYSGLFMPPADPFADANTIDYIKDWAFLIGRLGICVIGLAGEFLGNRTCLKLFIVLVCIDGLTGIITVILSDPTGVLTLNNRQTVEEMWAAQNKYNWAPNSKVEQEEDSSSKGSKWENDDDMEAITDIWNNLQAGGCCGIDGYNDWDKWRPDGYPGSSYPNSCCDTPNVTLDSDPSVELCDKETVYLEGCRKSVQEADSNQMTMTFWIGVFELGLAVVAYKVYKDCDPDHPSYEEMRNHHNLKMHMHSPYNQPIMHSLKGHNDRHSKDDWDRKSDPPRYGSTNEDKDTLVFSSHDKFSP